MSTSSFRFDRCHTRHSAFRFELGIATPASTSRYTMLIAMVAAGYAL
jgi:hypothetical protein